jgi:TP901 family phage tail tape measure protein
VADRSVKVYLRAETSQFTSDMGKAAKATQQVGDAADQTSKKGAAGFSGVLSWVDKNSAAVSSLTTKIGLVGVGLTAMAALAVKRWADFDQSLSNVAATGDDARANMAALRDAAIEAGKRTVYSASDAAAAIEDLSKAGLSAADILGGALDGSLDLAAAGSLDVAEAAGYTSIALSQFHLSGDKAAHVADLLAAGAGKAQGDVSDLGQALKQGGLVASQTGLSIEETTAALAAFAQAGLLGSDAGTSLKTMLQRLTPQSAEAQAEFDKLGISAYDAQGQFVGLANFAGQLQTKMSGLTPEARNAALAVMFGSDAVRAASVLYDQGAAGIKKWTSAVDDSGYAADVAATRLDNLKGDWEQLSGSVETALIGIGEGVDGPLRALIQTATNLVNAFADLPTEVQQGTLAIVGGGGLSALGIAGLGKLVIAVSEVKTAMSALKISASAASIATGAIGGALVIGTNLLSQWADEAARSKQNTDDFADTLDAATGAITDSTREMAAQKVAGTEAARIYKNLGGDVADLTGYVLGNADAIERVNAVLAAQPKEEFFWTTSDNAGVAQVTKDLTSLTGSLTDSKEAFQLQALAAGTSTDALDEQKSALEKYTDAQASGTATTEDYTDALQELIDAQAKAAGVVLSVRDAQRQYEQALDDATASLQENGTTLDVTTEAGRRNQAALDDIASSGWDLIDSMQANGATQETLQNTMAATRQSFLDAAEAMGMSSEDANALADSLNLIPTSVNVAVAADTSAAQAAVDAFVASLANRVATIRVRSVATDLNGDVSGSGRMGTFATGGAVYGPGTATSDSVVARLSAGEHVWTAAEVAGAGGHRAVERLRAVARTGSAPGFAAGGPVGPIRGYAAGGPVSSSATTVSVSLPPDGWAITGRLEMGTDGLVRLVDGRIAQAASGVRLASRVRAGGA